jgi:hypothetical protein
MKNDLVVFEDADGNIHEVYTAMRVRYKGGRPWLILRETTAKDFLLEVKQPPQELIESLEKYNEKHDLL